MASVRLTVLPFTCVWKLLSRVSFTRAAIRSRAQSHVFSSHPLPRGARSSPFFKRRRLLTTWIAAAPLLHSVPSLIGWPASPSMLITLPWRVETTWPQPTPQKGQTVVVSVAPRVLSGGVAGSPPDGDKTPTATVPVVSPLRNWRRVGCGGSVFAAASPPSRFTLSSFFIAVSSVRRG